MLGKKGKFGINIEDMNCSGSTATRNPLFQLYARKIDELDRRIPQAGIYTGLYL